MRTTIATFGILAATLVMPRPAASQQSAPLVRALKFEHLNGVSASEILDRFKEREIHLAVEKPFRAEDLDEAKNRLRELLSEKGQSGAQVRAVAKHVPSNRVDVVFTVVTKKRL